MVFLFLLNLPTVKFSFIYSFGRFVSNCPPSNHWLATISSPPRTGPVVITWLVPGVVTGLVHMVVTGLVPGVITCHHVIGSQGSLRDWFPWSSRDRFLWSSRDCIPWSSRDWFPWSSRDWFLWLSRDWKNLFVPEIFISLSFVRQLNPSGSLKIRLRNQNGLLGQVFVYWANESWSKTLFCIKKIYFLNKLDWDSLVPNNESIQTLLKVRIWERIARITSREQITAQNRIILQNNVKLQANRLYQSRKVFTYSIFFRKLNKFSSYFSIWIDVGSTSGISVSPDFKLEVREYVLLCETWTKRSDSKSCGPVSLKGMCHEIFKLYFFTIWTHLGLFNKQTKIFFKSVSISPIWAPIIKKG